MTNYEKYKKQIEKFARLSISFALNKDNKEIIECAGHICDDCAFNNSSGGCDDNKIDWADAEYIDPEVDWSKVAVDTPILVKQLRHNDWSRRYFSHYDNKNGLVCAFSEGKTSWTGQDDWKSWNYAKLAEVNDGI
jgi:hypothetical protein